MEELFFMIELFTLKYKRNSDKKIEKTGIVYFRTIDRGEYTNSDLNTILTRVVEKFGLERMMVEYLLTTKDKG